MKKHQKHTKLTKPDLGIFGRNELAIIGTPCGNIKNLAFGIIENLAKKNELSYVDADHKSADEASEETPKTALGFGAALEYTDKIIFSRFDYQKEPNQFAMKPMFNDSDLVLINGNHFVGKSQIVVLDEKKYASLEKKLDRLTDVKLILLATGNEEMPDFLATHLGKKNFPILSLNDAEKIAEFVTDFLAESAPLVNGLVLSGGKSHRMKTDKGVLQYHGKPQREYMYEVLEEICDGKAFLSARENQVENNAQNIITDSFHDLGPYSGILSAFRSNPNAAWLTVACDLPFLQKSDLELLISKRNPSKLATTFLNPKSNFPEPLITIWEPRAYPVLLHFLSLGYSCPRKVLINTDCELLTIPDIKSFVNVNYPEEYEEVLKEIRLQDTRF